VRGLTHSFYRYPARFSPNFARAAIEAYTVEGDTVLDPFVGGGTSVVEALAAGRRGVGVDLNSLAVFVTRAKTTPLSYKERIAVEKWLTRNSDPTVKHPDVVGRFGHFGKDVPLHLRHVIGVALEEAGRLPARAGSFARCSLLRTAQWALDCRQFIPTPQAFLDALARNTLEMLDQLADFTRVAAAAGGTPRSRLTSRRRLVRRNVADLEPSHLPRGWPKAKLVVTSPPYVGVNVLYNRWQVQGRRETTFPYGISGTVDGYYASHYTFVHRSRPVDEYVPKLLATFSAVRKLIARDAWVVQLVAFSDPQKQLPHYLETMEVAGYREHLDRGERRRWREVPNRRWYNRTSDRHEPASREVLLLHRPD